MTKDIKIAPLLGMLIGIGIGLYLDYLILNFTNSNKISPEFIVYLLKNYNSLYYPKSGPLWLDILTFPLLGALVGVLVGVGIKGISKKKNFQIQKKG